MIGIGKRRRRRRRRSRRRRRENDDTKDRLDTIEKNYLSINEKRREEMLNKTTNTRRLVIEW